MNSGHKRVIREIIETLEKVSNENTEIIQFLVRRKGQEKEYYQTLDKLREVNLGISRAIGMTESTIIFE